MQESPTELALAVMQRYRDDLLRMANVVGVGVGLRSVGGAQTGEPAVVVMVTHKVPRNRLRPQDVIPRELDGAPVDVQEVGEIGALPS